VEVDPTVRFVDERVDPPMWAYVVPQHVDWSVWPLRFQFVAARVDQPDQLGQFTVSVHPDTAKKDWGQCVVQTTGPGKVAGCTMLDDLTGGCLAAYAQRHGLRAR